MLKKYYIVFLLIPFCFAGTVEDSGCKKLLGNYYSKMNISKSPKSGQCYYMHMLSESVMKDSSLYPKVKSEVKLIMTDKIYFYLSDLMNIYKDDKDMFVVTKADKSVYWMDAVDEKKGNFAETNTKLFQMRDSLLMSSEIVSCKDFAENGRNYKRMDLVVPVKLRAKSNLQGFSCIMDMNDSLLTQLKMNYVPSYKVKQTTVTYKTVDFNYTTPPKEKNVKEIFITSSGKLTTKYKGYELVDNRSKTKVKSKKTH